MRLILALVLMLAAVLPVAAGPTDVTVTSGTVALTVRQTDSFSRDSRIVALTLSWTSTSGGAVTATLPSFHGRIVRVVTNPGSTAPTDNWDMVLNDEDGLDLFATKGADRDTANSEQFVPFCSDGTTFVPMTLAGTSTLLITNAGSAKTGAVTIYLER